MRTVQVAASLLVAFLWGAPLFAQSREAPAPEEPPQSITGAYSPYEEETIRDALTRLGTSLEPEPEGKIIEGIDIVPLDVIEERDPAPRLLNIFHATTRPYVVEREVLQRPGQPYRKVLIDESARNLRQLIQLSLVIATATRGSAPDRVRVLVITKDVWSLRLNWNVQLTPGGLQSLTLQPSEENFFGTHQTVNGFFEYRPETYTFGAGYNVPRLVGRWLVLDADAEVVLNRRTGQPEGTYGNVSITRPLYSTRTDWSWGVGALWQNQILRRYVDAQLGAYVSPENPNGPRVPYEYRIRRFVEQASVTRSFGWATKNDFTAGLEFNRLEYLTPDFSAYDPAVVAEFVRTRVPVGETRVGPFVQWHGYTTNFVRVLDFETLALQEDFRLGHDLIARVYPVSAALGSTRSLLGTYAAAQYTVPLRDGIVRGSVESTTEEDANFVSDASVGVNGRIMTPRMPFGRVVFDTAIINRYRNSLNRHTFLGGDTRLRGYPASFFVGKDLLASNVEFRTRPLEILKVQVGGVLFYDVGDAFDGFDNIHPKHSAGFGVRTLFPQLDRVVFRADVGFPLTAGPLPAGVSPVSFFLTFDQAFPVYAVGGQITGVGSIQNGVGGALGQ